MTEAEFLKVISEAITVASRRSDHDPARKRITWGRLSLAHRIILETAELIFDPLLEDDDRRQLGAAERTFWALSEYFYSVSEALREFRR